LPGRHRIDLDLYMPLLKLTCKNTLPIDGVEGTLIGRAWVPGETAGPSPVVLRADGVFDLSQAFPTLSDLLESASPLDAVRGTRGQFIGSLDALLANTGPGSDPAKAYLLPPADLQVIKAAGVTFAASMIERVIEEQAGGDAAKAESVRGLVKAAIGDNLRSIKPGSSEAARLKADRAGAVVTISGSRNWP
jgi:fumarylacetoacetate (FAA) hydrolase family protein